MVAVASPEHASNFKLHLSLNHLIADVPVTMVFYRKEVNLLEARTVPLENVEKDQDRGAEGAFEKFSESPFSAVEVIPYDD